MAAARPESESASLVEMLVTVIPGGKHPGGVNWVFKGTDPRGSSSGTIRPSRSTRIIVPQVGTRQKLLMRRPQKSGNQTRAKISLRARHSLRDELSNYLSPEASDSDSVAFSET
ncbi:hypothetical protein PCANC_19103 [Puccinia coronata f. sp. avenae]|uniref:Uncharacterized protein n=1 Tax=Puccinia coronata f. sp. avenae TaxID=200324 RepID=A0A2N5SSF5_9BASI|nr:hypothetical protein PCANC_19103 [Puccinia coronata f. sp. avenae]